MIRLPGGRGLTLALFLVVCFGFFPGMAAGEEDLTLQISDQRDGTVYYTQAIRPGEELSYGWEHSFEHVAWQEYYTVQEDGCLALTTIAVGGFGAGIPAEMDCTYRFEDGLIYMENIQGSVFPEICWIHSQTQVQWIAVGGEVILSGEDLPQRARLRLQIE